MVINVAKQESITIIHFETMEQLYEPEILRDTIYPLIQEGRKDFLFDMENIAYISSSVLGFIITLYQDLKAKKGHLKLVNVQPSVSNLLAITRLDKIVELFNDQETAMKSFQ